MLFLLNWAGRGPEQDFKIVVISVMSLFLCILYLWRLILLPLIPGLRLPRRLLPLPLELVNEISTLEIVPRLPCVIILTVATPLQ